MERRSFWPAAVVVAAAIGLTASLTLPYQGFPGDAVVMRIAPGASAADVAGRVADSGVIRSPALFRWLVRLSRTATQLQAGEYRFAGASSALAVHRQLLDGDVLLHRVTVPEGLWIREVVELLAEAGLGELDALRQAAADPTLVRDLDPAAEDLEGYLFPDTYQIPRGMPADELLGRMVGRFREVFGPAERARAAEIGLTVREAVTLASLVEEETAEPGERPLVASVFHNRLRRRMLLQCDPTVIYALERHGRYPGKLTRNGLKFDSPYNTYLYPGLPPGPIANPGAEALQATLHPSETDFLYFVSRNDGSHQFSRRFQEHLRAVNRFQRSRRPSR